MDMRAYEFDTVYRNGMIDVPERYRRELREAPVKVILLQTERQSPPEPVSFTALALPTKGFVFNREEANER